MKQFLIIGNINAVAYKQVFPLIKAGQVRLGVCNRTRAFVTPEGKEQPFGNTYWFTTLSHGHINPPLALTATYMPDAYPKYDNYDAINVDRVKDIPCDYDGVMGVPISFLDKWCAEQFEIVGITRLWGGMATKIYKDSTDAREDGCDTRAQILNSGPNIAVEELPAGAKFYIYQGVILKRLYNRILIRRKCPDHLRDIRK